jgi:uncharacterized repeat protein (TIGR01451 family)
LGRAAGSRRRFARLAFERLEDRHLLAVTLDTLHSFAGEQVAPATPLTSAGSILYGVTEYGGNDSQGSVYAINANGTGYRVLYSFSGLDGSDPAAGLTLVGSTLYGTTASGGNYDYGTIFSINTNGSGFQTLHSFSGNDGAEPAANLTLGGSTLYGTTESGGSSDDGTIFSINTGGSDLQTLYSFSTASIDVGALTLGGSTLYGTTGAGGSNDHGTIFSVNTNGTGFQTLDSFYPYDGQTPDSQLALVGSTLYGTIETYTTPFSSVAGGLFSVNINGSNFQILNNSLDYPTSSLTVSGSTLYGTTEMGGNNGFGTLYSIHTDGSSFTTLNSFAKPVGSNISGLMLIGSTCYATTLSASSTPGTVSGVIFSIGIDGSSLQTLGSFTESNFEGNSPSAGLTLVGSTLYGTTTSGGSNNTGTIFSVSTDGTGYQTLCSFPANQQDPTGNLTLVGSTIYGATGEGGTDGDGTIFSVNTDGTDFQTLYSFSGTDGYFPRGSLTLIGSTLFGADAGTTTLTDGAVFSIHTDGSDFQVLHAFSGTQGSHVNPAFTLVGSTLYGTTNAGGSANDGTIFSISTDGTGFQTVYTFSTTGGIFPEGALNLVGSTFFGVTFESGTGDNGTIFSVSTAGTGYQTLHTFSGSDGINPIGLTLVGTTLYGTTDAGGTANDGTIFSINTDGSAFQTLHPFLGTLDGLDPNAGFTPAGSTLYGTAHAGGVYNAGTVFALPLAGLAVSNSAAAMVITGQNLTYSITVSNAGPSDAQNVSFADSLPAGETLVSQSQTAGPSFTPGGTGNQLADTIATLPAGDSATFTVVATVGGVAGGTVLNDKASIGDDGFNDLVSSTATTTVDIPPTVVGAFVSGTGWNVSYLSMLDAAGLGFELASGADQLTTILPWTNANEISIAFSEPVNVSQGSLTLYDSTNTAIPSSGFSYNATSNIATWQFATALPANKYVMNLAAGSVTDSIGTELDGAWTTGVSTFAAGSGDGTPGSDFNFYFDALPGDANSSGTVTNGDVLLTKLQVGAVANSSNYQLDVNGAANITNSDVLLEKLEVGSNINTFAAPQLPAQSAVAASPDIMVPTNDSGGQSPLMPLATTIFGVASPDAVSASIATNVPTSTMAPSPDIAAASVPTVAASTPIAPPPTIAPAAAIGPPEAVPELPISVSPAVIDQALAAQVILAAPPQIVATAQVAGPAQPVASTTTTVLSETEAVLPAIFAELASVAPAMPRMFAGAASASYSERALANGLPIVSQLGSPALTDEFFGEMAAPEPSADRTDRSLDFWRIGWLGQ